MDELDRRLKERINSAANRFQPEVDRAAERFIRRLRRARASILGINVLVLLLVIASLVWATSKFVTSSRPIVAGPPIESVVPWVSARPSPSPYPSAPAMPCTAAELSIGEFGGFNGAGGTAYSSAPIRNKSSEPCFLGRDAAVLFLDAGGRAVQSAETVGMWNARDFIVVSPEEELAREDAVAYRGLLRLGVSTACSPPISASRMEISLPGGAGTLVVRLPPYKNPPADHCPSGGYGASFDLEATSPERPASPLRAELLVSDAGSGERFRYLVRLVNPTGREFSLDPCPAYSQGFGADGGTSENYLLNCSEVRAIPAGESVTYEMFVEMSIRLTMQAEDGRRLLLNWSLEDYRYSGPEARAWVRLTG